MMGEQEFIAARKQLQTAIQTYSAIKQDLVSAYINEHYPGLNFTVEIKKDDLSMDVVFDAITGQAKDILQDVSAYLAALNKQAEEN